MRYHSILVSSILIIGTHGWLFRLLIFHAASIGQLEDDNFLPSNIWPLLDSMFTYFFWQPCIFRPSTAGIWLSCQDVFRGSNRFHWNHSINRLDHPDGPIIISANKCVLELNMRKHCGIGSSTERGASDSGTPVVPLSLGNEGPFSRIIFPMLVSSFKP